MGAVRWTLRAQGRLRPRHVLFDADGEELARVTRDGRVQALRAAGAKDADGRTWRVVGPADALRVSCDGEPRATVEDGVLEVEGRTFGWRLAEDGSRTARVTSAAGGGTLLRIARADGDAWAAIEIEDALPEPFAVVLAACFRLLEAEDAIWGPGRPGTGGRKAAAARERAGAEAGGRAAAGAGGGAASRPGGGAVSQPGGSATAGVGDSSLDEPRSAARGGAGGTDGGGLDGPAEGGAGGVDGSERADPARGGSSSAGGGDQRDVHAQGASGDDEIDGHARGAATSADAPSGAAVGGPGPATPARPTDGAPAENGAPADGAEEGTHWALFVRGRVRPRILLSDGGDDALAELHVRGMPSGSLGRATDRDGRRFEAKLDGGLVTVSCAGRVLAAVQGDELTVGGRTLGWNAALDGTKVATVIGEDGELLLEVGPGAGGEDPWIAIAWSDHLPSPLAVTLATCFVLLRVDALGRRA